MKDFFKKKRNIKLNKVLFFIIILIFFSHFNEKKSYAVFNIDIHGGYASIPSNLVDNVDHNFHTGLGIGVDIFRIQPWIMWQFRMEFDSHLFLYGDIPIRSNFPLFFGSRFIFWWW